MNRYYVWIVIVEETDMPTRDSWNQDSSSMEEEDVGLLFLRIWVNICITIC